MEWRRGVKLREKKEQKEHKKEFLLKKKNGEGKGLVYNSGLALGPFSLDLPLFLLRDPLGSKSALCISPPTETSAIIHFSLCHER